MEKKHWDLIFVTLFAYFIGYKLLHTHFHSLKIESIGLLIHHVLFNVPFLMDFVLSISSCFFLKNMCDRFQMVIDLWKCLPPGLVPVSDQWTNEKIVVFMENTRLLHSELSELLKIFTLGYGPMLLSFFTFNFINMLLCIYLVFNNAMLSRSQSNKNALQISALMMHVQIVTFLMSIIVLVSFINEKVTKKVVHPHIFFIY